MTSAYFYIAIQPALPAGLSVPVRIRLPGTSLVNNTLESLIVIFPCAPATSHAASQHRPSKRIPACLSFALAILLIFLNRLGVLEKLCFGLMAWGTALTRATVICFFTELICLTSIFFSSRFFSDQQ